MKFKNGILDYIVSFNLSDFYSNVHEHFNCWIFQSLNLEKIQYDKFSAKSKGYDEDGILNYEGHVVSGKRKGYGIEYYRSSSQGKIKYQGFFKNDRPTAELTKICHQSERLIYSGSTYRGEPK